ncbi:hypothetical protein GCM10023093_17670 [Nemorincola caseinilytica]|uniref:BT4734-like N-terminal domain-containing protein n=1 Tax=Nemorincola caseinilytica TaxID=2054315 RepID=A0ABP8NGH0_9BACT
MFSYFKSGIKDRIPSKKISIEALVKEIKANNNPTIQSIRGLDVNHVDYEATKKKLKEHLPYITPNCTVSKRNDESIIEFSGYMYFDIDDVENASEYKAQLIEQYKDHISLMCISSSGRGLSFFVKIENEITRETFAGIRKYIFTHIFTGIRLDPKVKDKSRAWFVSYDPDCYFNPCAIICVPQNIIDNIGNSKQVKDKGANHKIYSTSTDCLSTAPYQYKLIPISDVLNTLKFRTDVHVENRIFDLKPVEYCEVFLRPSYRIPKGSKHSVFSQVIHNLVYLNPDVSPDYIFSYINYLNFNRTEPGTAATMRDLISHFNMVYTGIQKTGIISPTTRIKFFHCRPNTISPLQRSKLSKKIIGLYRISETVNRISLAKQVLEAQGANDKQSEKGIIISSSAPSKITQKDVHRLINDIAKTKGLKGIGIRTVKTYWNYEPIDMDEVVRIENERMEITYVSAEQGYTNDAVIDDAVKSTTNRVLDAQIRDQIKNVVHYKAERDLSEYKQHVPSVPLPVLSFLGCGVQ